MTRHRHDNGELVRRPVEHDDVEHHQDADPGLLVVTGAPAQVCPACDEYWFDEETGLALAELIRQHRPAPGEVRTIAWVEVHAA
ncbi:MAG: YgiT-type zinc finger protein [Actinobacteria bacterium]|nr:YgiT-type zinc finger protein [Actinomycetota bacterium]